MIAMSASTYMRPTPSKKRVLLPFWLAQLAFMLFFTVIYCLIESSQRFQHVRPPPVRLTIPFRTKYSTETQTLSHIHNHLFHRHIAVIDRDPHLPSSANVHLASHVLKGSRYIN